MLRLTRMGISCGVISTLFAGSALLALTGCSAAEGDEPSAGSETVEHTQAALAPGWVTVTPKNGWSNFSSSTPAAVGNFNGVIVFRGALKAMNPSSTTVFDMPAQFQPGSAIFMKISLSGGAGGMLEYDYLCHCVKVFQDGVSPAGVGTAAKTFTSLDGASFDLTEGTGYFATGQQQPGPWPWESTYGFRPLQNGDQGVFYVKQVDGFVRLQGFLAQRPAQRFDNYLFTLPSNLAPADTVQVYASLGTEEFSDTSWGTLAIYSNGAVYVQG
ncbi:MAG TPA: hypothetical protein VGQ57_16730, partial [Polyangiaceae bacterium]|nr:hypothetical protein [Polyangiaceae bacterium]